MQRINTLLTSNDLILVPVYLLVILTIAYFIKNRNISKINEFKYFISGLLFKLIGVISFILIYIYYYKGGDTVNYFYGTQSVANLLIQDFEKGMAVILNSDSYMNDWSSFNTGTGYPPHYMWKDPKTFSVSRYTVPLYFLASKSFIITSFFTACFSFIGVWKLYRLFNMLYPGYSKVFAYLILFLPTLIFWGGGIMKDSYVLGATCWLTYNFYQVFIIRKKVLINSFFILFNLFLIINIKSYIIVSLLPGMLLWLNSAYLKNFKSSIVKVLVFPILFISISFIGIFISNNLSSFVGIYGDVDTAIQQAQIIQEDLLREEQYGGNNYDIGQLDGSLSGLIKVAPVAIFTALFRPMIWEIGSPTMVFSAIENTILVLFTLYILLKISPYKLLKLLWKEPFLLYCFIFSIFFSFGVGIAGTNFGALVRYKTPLIPFFFSMIYVIYSKNKIKKI